MLATRLRGLEVRADTERYAAALTCARRPLTDAARRVLFFSRAMIDRDPVAAHPHLSWHGLSARPARSGTLAVFNARTTVPTSATEYQRADAFLGVAPLLWCRLNRRYDVYDREGIPELWAGGYVSEGMFLATAPNLGVRVERDVNGRCAFLKLAPATLNMADPFARGRRCSATVPPYLRNVRRGEGGPVG